MISVQLLDSMEMYKTMPDKSIDLIVTDPPYQLDNSACGAAHVKMSLTKIAKGDGYNLDKIAHGWDHAAHMCQWRRLMAKFHAFIFCSNAQVSRLMQWGEERGMVTTLLCWNKTNTAPLANGVWRQDAEWIVHIREKGATFQGTAQEKCKVYSSPCVRSKYNHPTEKSEALISRYIEIGSTEGMTVMDPFSGSGTTAACCARLGRNFIGAEINPEYHRRSLARIEEIQTNLIAYHDQQMEMPW